MIGETAVYAMPGLLLFAKRGSVMAQAFDAERGVLAGTPPVQVASGSGSMVFVSENGRLLYRAGSDGETMQSAIVRLDRKGAVLGRSARRRPMAT